MGERIPGEDVDGPLEVILEALERAWGAEGFAEADPHHEDLLETLADWGEDRHTRELVRDRSGRWRVRQRLVVVTEGTTARIVEVPMQVKLGPEDAARAGRVRAAVGARSVAELVRVALAILEAGVVAPAGPCGAMAEAARGVVRRGARGLAGVQAAVAEAVGGVEVVVATSGDALVGEVAARAASARLEGCAERWGGGSEDWRVAPAKRGVGLDLGRDGVGVYTGSLAEAVYAAREAGGGRPFPLAVRDALEGAGLSVHHIEEVSSKGRRSYRVTVDVDATAGAPAAVARGVGVGDG